MKSINNFILLFILILTLALLPSDGLENIHIPFFDKIKHMVAFFLLSYFLYRSITKINYIYKTIILILLALMIEILQSFVERDSNFLDFIFSCLGIILFFIVLKVINKNRD